VFVLDHIPPTPLDRALSARLQVVDSSERLAAAIRELSTDVP
jgi:hypothetical protein